MTDTELEPDEPIDVSPLLTVHLDPEPLTVLLSHAEQVTTCVMDSINASQADCALVIIPDGEGGGVSLLVDKLGTAFAAWSIEANARFIELMRNTSADSIVASTEEMTRKYAEAINAAEEKTCEEAAMGRLNTGVTLIKAGAPLNAAELSKTRAVSSDKTIDN